MKKTKCIRFLVLLFTCSLIFMGNTAHASGDSCTFMLTADDVPPKIVILLDNGTSMEQIYWHENYDNSVDYTPIVGVETDVVQNSGSGNGFFNENGYGIVNIGTENNRQYCLGPILDSLEIDSTNCLPATTSSFKDQYGTATWTISDPLNDPLKEKTLTLPSEPSNAYVDGITDRAVNFRYSKNYLNWLFFTDNYSGTGSDLPNKSRFYFAKKAIMTVAKITANKAELGLYAFNSDFEGAKREQPISEVVNTPLAANPLNNTLTTEFYNNVNKMETTLYSPLAEGLASVGGEFADPSTHVVGLYCQKLFAIVISPGVSSENKPALFVSEHPPVPGVLSDDDGDGENPSITISGTSYSIPTKHNGSTYLDDVAYYLYSNDIPQYVNAEGFQNIRTYTIGYMGTEEGNRFLINTSNNGNGNFNLYDETQPDYGKYHYVAESPQSLSDSILDAVNDIISNTSAFTAPVVPVTRTTSGNRIYMAFFKPNEGNFWEGYVNKFGLNAQNEIIDANGNPATWANGAMREDAVPFWSTKDWINTPHTSRIIYTYLGTNVVDLIASENAFDTSNSNLTDLILGYPTDITVNGIPVNGRAKVINYVRGADVLDWDEDAITDENRDFITGDVQHSEPLVFTYHYATNPSKTMVFFGANDGMLHAVLDQTDPDITVSGDETHYGRELWSFIPPDQLIRLKYLIEGSSHMEFVDSSPKIYFHDADKNGLVDQNDDQVILVCGERRGGSSYFALDVTVPEEPKYMWRIGSGNENTIIRYDKQTHTLDFGVNNWVGDLTTAMYNDQMNAGPFVWGQIVTLIPTGLKTGILELANIYRHAGGAFEDGDTLRLWDGAGGWDDAAQVDGDELLAPDVIIPELGESWSVPQFGLVKTTDSDTDGTAVFFIGGGYHEYNALGRAVVAVNVLNGEVVRKFTNVTSNTADVVHTTDTNIYYSVPSTVKVIDEDNNGFVDKVYVGDLGGQLWRIGQVSVNSGGTALSFPDCDENINNWTGQILFRAPTYVVDSTTYTRKFFFPPSVTLENGYDLVFIGTGDREDACDTTTGADRIYAVKDTHGSTTLTETDLVDVTDPLATTPNLDHTTGDVDLNGVNDQGWYIRLVDQYGTAVGEKALAKSTVFYKTLYITTFTPNNDPCLPGGVGKIYAVDYKTGGAVLFVGSDIDGDGSADLTRGVIIGGGIPSRPVMVISKTSRKLLISVGSTLPEATSEVHHAGVIRIDPLEPSKNFFLKWWRQLFS